MGGMRDWVSTTVAAPARTRSASTRRPPVARERAHNATQAKVNKAASSASGIGWSVMPRRRSGSAVAPGLVGAMPMAKGAMASEGSTTSPQPRAMALSRPSSSSTSAAASPNSSSQP